MPVKIQIRRGTASEWTTANPVLLSGEQGLETDTRKVKIGDGTTAWNSLSYVDDKFLSLGTASGVYLTQSAAASAYLRTALPSQTGNSGKYLSTNGASATWADISGSVYSSASPANPTVGQIWVESDVDVNTYDTQIFTRWSRTLTSSAVSFSGLSSGVLLEYTPGYEQVYLNGILLLRNNDYTAANGSLVSLTASALPGDVVEVISPNTLSVANSYTASQTNALLSLYLPLDTAASAYLRTSTASALYSLPTQTGNTNHILATNGTITSWRAVEDDQFILSAQIFG